MELGFELDLVWTEPDNKRYDFKWEFWEALFRELLHHIAFFHIYLGINSINILPFNVMLFKLIKFIYSFGYKLSHPNLQPSIFSL